MNKETILKSETKEENLGIGQIFLHEEGDFYILGITDYDNCALINLRSGQRWVNGCKTFEGTFGLCRNSFKRVYDPITVAPRDKFNSVYYND